MYNAGTVAALTTLVSCDGLGGVRFFYALGYGRASSEAMTSSRCVGGVGRTSVMTGAARM
jgi:hypothetical protein